MPSLDNDSTCYCPDPFHEGQKLYLCGSALCTAIMNKTYRNGHNNETGRIIVTDDED